MVTKEEFIERFRQATAGMALYGLAMELDGGYIAKTTHALKIPAMVEKVLGAMYEFMATSVQQPKKDGAK